MSNMTVYNENFLPSTPDVEEKIKNKIETETEKIQRLLKQQKLEAAVEKIQSNLQNGYSVRDKLKWRMLLSQALIAQKKYNIALPHLKEIISEIDYYRLEKWEPDFALRLLTMTWTGFNAYPDKNIKNESSKIISRIAKINPVAALRLDN